MRERRWLVTTAVGGLIVLLVASGSTAAQEAVGEWRSFGAYHKDTGEYLGSVELPAVPGGNPITYLHEGKQYIAVAVGGRSVTPEVIALALPD